MVYSEGGKLSEPTKKCLGYQSFTPSLLDIKDLKTCPINLRCEIELYYVEDA